MTTELDFVNKRNTIKGSLDRQISYLQKADIEDLTLGDLTTRIQKLRELELAYENNQTTLESLLLRDTTADKGALLIEFNTEREGFENKILKALSAYNDAFFTVDKRENPGKYAEKTVANNSSSASQVQIVPQFM